MLRCLVGHSLLYFYSKFRKSYKMRILDTYCIWGFLQLPIYDPTNDIMMMKERLINRHYYLSIKLPCCSWESSLARLALLTVINSQIYDQLHYRAINRFIIKWTIRKNYIRLLWMAISSWWYTYYKQYHEFTTSIQWMKLQSVLACDKIIRPTSKPAIVPYNMLLSRRQNNFFLFSYFPSSSFPLDIRWVWALHFKWTNTEFFSLIL